jgi:NTP pyrophosphatase (non-canonical NTP hydrolase)
MSEELEFEHLRTAVLEWAAARSLLKPENAFKQMLKVSEEVGELAGAIAKNNREDTIDAIGDTLVTIIILSEQLGLDPTVCLLSAYQTIANRKGKTINGVFIKE